MKVSGAKIAQQPIMPGDIRWTDGDHMVRTPLEIYNYIPGASYNFDTYNSMTAGKTTLGVSSIHLKGIFGCNKILAHETQNEAF